MQSNFSRKNVAKNKNKLSMRKISEETMLTTVNATCLREQK